MAESFSAGDRDIFKAVRGSDGVKIGVVCREVLAALLPLIHRKEDRSFLEIKDAPSITCRARGRTELLQEPTDETSD